MEVTLANRALLKANEHHSRLLQKIQGQRPDARHYPTDCTVCTSIIRLLDVPAWDRCDLAISRESLLENDFCRNHGVLFGLSVDKSPEVVLFRRLANQTFVHIHPDPYHCDNSVCEAPWEFHFTNASSGLQPRSNSFQPRLINEQWIDLGLIKTWIRTCEHEHSICRVQDTDTALLPLLLVDTEKHCLAYIETAVRYVALSYVWGRTNTFMTMTNNISSLLKPGAFDLPSNHLPQTISQAIRLTNALGERYIWVDALCIIQDAEDRSDHLDAMASLFENACLTIVAATSEHADSGFEGLPGISRPRHAGQYAAELLPDVHLVKAHAKHVWDDGHLRPWSTRAWTFQEAICSRRMLYLGNNTVRWSCKLSKWSEESTSVDCASDYASLEQRRLDLTAPKLSSGRTPRIDELVSLINGYNIRTLTFPDDALAAFAGVASRLGDKFLGGFLCGLPVFFFDLCLLWRPSRRLGPARMRTNRLPSWSWAAYETEIVLPYTWMRQSDSSGATPIVLGDMQPFYTTTIQYGASEDQRHEIPCLWSKYAQSIVDGSCLPEWKASSSWDSGDSRAFGEFAKAPPYFSHESDEGFQFWFPVPLQVTAHLTDTMQTKNSSSSIQPSSLISKQDLYFKAATAFFQLGRTLRAATQILTYANELAGTLYPHDEQDPDLMRAASDEEHKTIELVAILGNTIPNEDFDIWQDMTGFPTQQDQSQHRHRDPRLYRSRDVYNVIWIKRTNGICYRKATGIVDRDIWEANSAQMVDIVLG